MDKLDSLKAASTSQRCKIDARRRDLDALIRESLFTLRALSTLDRDYGSLREKVNSLEAELKLAQVSWIGETAPSQETAKINQPQADAPFGRFAGMPDVEAYHNVLANEGSIDMDILAYNQGQMEAVHLAAFEILYGVHPERANNILGMCPNYMPAPHSLILSPNRSTCSVRIMHTSTSGLCAKSQPIPGYPTICKCFDGFATLLLKGKECGPARDRFLAEVVRAGPEELEALDKGAKVGGESVCSEALTFLRGALPRGWGVKRRAND
jgi:hypothetical protein